MLPTWYGKRYPTLADLQLYAQNLGAEVTLAPIGEEALYVPPFGQVPAVIILPRGLSPLRECWLLAHELGHLVQHSGPRGALLWSKDERAADHWAACALIPMAAVRRHQNASEDAFVGALSRHFEDLPSQNSPSRRLAGYIARVRLAVLMKEAV